MQLALNKSTLGLRPSRNTRVKCTVQPIIHIHIDSTVSITVKQQETTERVTPPNGVSLLDPASLLALAKTLTDILTQNNSSS